MSAPEGRARSAARSLLYLAGADAVIFLMAELANVSPLFALGGSSTAVAAGTGLILAVAAACGFVGAWSASGGAGHGRWIPFAALTNAILILAVAVYFAVEFQIFGDLGIAFGLLALPGLAAAVVGRVPHVPA